MMGTLASSQCPLMQRLTTQAGKNRDLARMLERTVKRQRAEVTHLESKMGEKRE
ncbi:MAG: hypothetical protein ACYC7D_15765 [Nitrososphaerales archaeon]